MKSFSFIKKIIITSLIGIALFLNIDYSAVVSDNDGAAFVTKSEFETLKKNFDEQIKNYNFSIDSKIDGAIASYLAGIRLATTEELDSLLNQINEKCTDAYVSGSILEKYGYRCMSKEWTAPTTQEPKGAITQAFIHWASLNNSTSVWMAGGFNRIGLNYDSRGNLRDVNIPSSGRQNGKYLLANKYKGKYYLTNSYANVCYRYYLTGHVGAISSAYWPSVSENFKFVLPEFKNESSSWSIEYANVQAGYPSSSVGLYNIRCFYGPTYEMTSENNVIPVCGKIEGTSYILENDKIKNMRLQNTVYNWTWYPASMVFYKRKSGSTWGDLSLGIDAVSSNFYFNCHPYEQMTLSDLIDYQSTVAYGDGDVVIYGGLPIFKATSTGEVTMKIEFKSAENHDVYVGLQKSQFLNNATYSIDSTLGLRNESGTKYTSNKFSHDTEYTFVMDVNKDDVIWIKTYDADSDTAFTGAETNGIVLVSE